MFFERILVAEAPYRAGSARRAENVSCRVGILSWSNDASWLSVIVRRTFRFPCACGPVSLDPIAPSPFAAERDFVPLRPLVDVTLTGHVEVAPAPSAKLAPKVAAFGLDDKPIAFRVDPAAPGRIPLAPPHTKDDLGRELRLGPGTCHDGAANDFRHRNDFDFRGYQCAPERLRYEEPKAECVRLLGILAQIDETEIALPSLWPRALVEYSEAGLDHVEVRLSLDSLGVDVDARTVDVTWRGHFESTAKPAEDVERVVLAWAERARWNDDAAGAWQDALRELPRGKFGWATERADAVQGCEPPALSEEQLAMARYESWDFPVGPEPELAPEHAAGIAAELCEERAPRADVLARHGIDDYGWSVEERAWAQRLARLEENDAGAPLGDEDGPGDDRRAYAEAFARASASYARPEEQAVELADYAKLTARIARGDPAARLSEAGLGLGSFMRVDRMWRERALADAPVAAEIERLVAEEEARLDAGEAARGDEEPA